MKIFRTTGTTSLQSCLHLKKKKKGEKLIQQTLWDSLEYCPLQISGLVELMNYYFLSSNAASETLCLRGRKKVFTYFYSRDLEVFLM